MTRSAQFIKNVVAPFLRTGVPILLYEKLANTLAEIESISGNLEKVRIFSEFLKDSDPQLIGKILALTTGKLHPDWMGKPELGIAEKMAVQVVVNAASVSEQVVTETLRETGDIGATAEELLQNSGQMSLAPQEATIESVHNTLNAVTLTAGSGSNKQKISLLVGLLTDSQPLEAKYILRTVTGTLRLGLSYMGILDALAIAFTGDKKTRNDIERAFNVCSDLGRVAQVLTSSGIEAVREIETKVGIPIRMMAAKKLTSSKEILEKVEGEAFIEYKYDGERVQVHKNGINVLLFSRRQENITPQYPDVVEYVVKHVKAERCVLEGECIAIDPVTRKIRPFQELMRRRRKTGIEEMRAEIPVALRFFDILYLNGVDVTRKTLLERREIMTDVVDE